MKVIIERLQQKDAKKLFEFESENKTYFEKTVPSRGKDYYDYNHFIHRHNELLEEQEIGQSYFYLIKNENEDIAGRINLTDIDTVRASGHIGYRVGEKFCGQGIASQALNLLLESVNEIGIKKIHAQTTKHNIASQKILERNNFIFVSAAEEDFEMAGNMFGFVYYEWTNK